jgi:prephenate dehydratase
MTRLESRPTGEAMGSYCFSIDIEGHIADARVAETLMGLKRVCAQVRYLGSYARADGRVARTPVGTSDADFDAARRWLEELRS